MNLYVVRGGRCAKLKTNENAHTEFASFLTSFSSFFSINTLKKQPRLHYKWTCTVAQLKVWGVWLFYLTLFSLSQTQRDTHAFWWSVVWKCRCKGVSECWLLSGKCCFFLSECVSDWFLCTIERSMRTDHRLCGISCVKQLPLHCAGPIYFTKKIIVFTFAYTTFVWKFS